MNGIRLTMDKDSESEKDNTLSTIELSIWSQYVGEKNHWSGDGRTSHCS